LEDFLGMQQDSSNKASNYQSLPANAEKGLMELAE
jgi:hypothetical protein